MGNSELINRNGTKILSLVGLRKPDGSPDYTIDCIYETILWDNGDEWDQRYRYVVAGPLITNVIVFKDTELRNAVATWLDNANYLKLATTPHQQLLVDAVGVENWSEYHG